MKHIILLFVSISALTACRFHSNVHPPDTVGVNITVGAALFSDIRDERISSLRVIAFDPADQTVVRNVFYPAVDMNNTILLSIDAGTYDFVFLANEPEGSSLILDAVAAMDDLAAITFPASAFNSNDDIPMILTVEDVTVLEDDLGVSIDGGPVLSTWLVELERLAVRFDIVLKSAVDLSDELRGVVISNIPDGVPLFGFYDGPHTTSRTFMIDTPADAAYFRDTTIEGVTWAQVIHRVILPANDFSPADTPENVMVLDVLLGDPAIIMSCTLGLDEEGGNYTMPRNKYVTVSGVISFPMEVNLEVAEWVATEVDGNVANRFLNVSELAPQVYDGAVTRLYFWSNQPSVSVEALGYSGASGSAPFTVNTLFNNLAGAGSPNLSYDPATGMGYIDIASLVNIPGQTTNRIILNANGLRREIAVTVNMTELVPWSLIHYVGTFHRWNQTGERVISMAHSGAWTAEVLSGDFVLLNRNPSPATIAGILGTVNPGDAENYQLPGGATAVSGNGRIFFRVGMTGPAPSPGVPRYALIRLTPSSGVASLLYVRQGEAPAVINSTVEWSVYNVSDPLRGPGGPNATDHSLFTPQAPVTPTTFADYPTQVGYMFRWNLYDPAAPGTNRAWHSRNPVGSPPATGITGYPAGFASVWDPANDPCPAGYRHPTNAEFAAFAPDMNNSAWGFYADGFFDRGTIFGNAYVTGALNYQLGTYGRVFYNSATNASLFMPAAGNRIGSTGFLGYTESGNYSSSNLQSVTFGNVLTLFFNSGLVNPNDVQFARGRAFSVRCIEN